MLIVNDLRDSIGRARQIINTAVLSDAVKCIRTMENIVSEEPVDIDLLKKHLRLAVKIRSRVMYIRDEALPHEVDLKNDCDRYCNLVSKLIATNILGEEGAT